MVGTRSTTVKRKRRRHRPETPPPGRFFRQRPSSKLAAKPSPPPTPSRGESADALTKSRAPPSKAVPPAVPDPLSKLKLPQTRNGPQFSKRGKECLEVIHSAKAVLVKELLAREARGIDDLIALANGKFETLNFYGADYESFHSAVRSFIGFHHDLVLTEGVGNGGLREMKDRHENLLVQSKDLVVQCRDAEEAVSMVVERVGNHKRKIAERRDELVKLEQELAEVESEMANLEGERAALEAERDRRARVHSSIEAEAVKVGLTVEELSVLEQVKEEATDGIEKMKTKLLSELDLCIGY